MKRMGTIKKHQQPRNEKSEKELKSTCRLVRRQHKKAFSNLHYSNTSQKYIHWGYSLTRNIS